MGKEVVSEGESVDAVDARREFLARSASLEPRTRRRGSSSSLAGDVDDACSRTSDEMWRLLRASAALKLRMALLTGSGS